jgi:hypothetical protein
MSVEDAVHIVENFEYAETLGYTAWHKRQWERDFVERHLGKRFAFLDREKAVVLPFYDGVFSYAYIISPGGCCGNNLNRDIFRISRIDINYDWGDGALRYADAISELLGSTPLSLSEAWDPVMDKIRGERSGASSAGWTPTWYRFSPGTAINALRNAPEHTNSDSPTIEQDFNLHARDKSADAALGAMAKNNNYMVAAPGIRFLGSPNGTELKESRDICISSCRADNTCGGFQYELESGKCQLFRDIYKSQRDPRFYSGAKVPNNINPAAGNVYYSYSNYKYGSQAILLGDGIIVPESMRIKNIGDCERLCTDAFDCLWGESNSRAVLLIL